MRQDYKQLFSNLQEPAPSAGLSDRVIASIKADRKWRQIHLRVYAYLAIFVFSSIALIPSVLLVRNNLSGTGFTQYFSLLFTDFSVIMGYWQNYSLTLLESLPTFSLSVFLGLIVLILLSFRKLTIYLRPSQLSWTFKH